jgi:hypothetical protein
MKTITYKGTTYYCSYADLLPPLTPAEHEALADDIRRRGVIVAVMVDDHNNVIDGQHRLEIAAELGLEVPFKVVAGLDDAQKLDLALHLNTHRRHLTPSQRGMCLARAEGLMEKYANEALERKRKGGQDAGRSRPQQDVECIPQPIVPSDPIVQTGKSRDRLGALFGISGRTVDHARRLLDGGVPELIQAVEDGRMGLATAAKLTSQPEDVQRQESAKPAPRRGPKPKPKPKPDAGAGGKPTVDEARAKGVGVLLATKAMNILHSIPRHDPLRADGLQMVANWLKKNR